MIFANDIWFAAVQPGNNGPFWSLTYEVWYYILFACAVYFQGRLRYWLMAISVVVAGPRVILMFPVWLTGVAAYMVTRRTQGPRVAVGLAPFVSSTLVLSGLVVWRSHYATCGADCYGLAALGRPLLDWREYAVDYCIGLLIGLNFVGFYLSAPCWAAPIAIVRRPVQWLAGATFTLYLLHYPMAQFLVAVSPWTLGSARQQAFVYGVTLAAVFCGRTVYGAAKEYLACHDPTPFLPELETVQHPG